MPESVFPVNPSVVRFYHDDWLVNVLLSDGRVYTFCTEMWDEHDAITLAGGSNGDWTPVLARASREALRLAAAGAQTWALEELPATLEDFHRGMDSLCERTSDADFRRFIR